MFATGGLGGVHRDARDTWDESADLLALASLPITVVCAGVKSILDVGAPWNGWRPWASPCSASAPIASPASTCATPGIASTGGSTRGRGRRRLHARESLGTDRRGLVVANPLPEDEQVDPALHERLLTAGLAAAAAAGIAARTSRRSCSSSSTARASGGA